MNKLQTVPQVTLKKIQTDFPCVKISCSKDCYDFCSQFYGDDIEIFESMFLLMVNQGNQTISYAKISQGGITGTVVDVRIIAKYAVDSLATGVFLCHNHPGGGLYPSDSDIGTTEKVKKALSLLDIRVLDHIILTSKGYYSFADQGML